MATRETVSIGRSDDERFGKSALYSGYRYGQAQKTPDWASEHTTLFGVWKRQKWNSSSREQKQNRAANIGEALLTEIAASLSLFPPTSHIEKS